MEKVGFTTSIPVEILFAAGVTPVDLNNTFISDNNPAGLVEIAENEGFPRNACSWIKGIYASVMKNPGLDAVITVVEGDCSNTRALMEVFEMEGIECIPFSYPISKDYDKLKSEIERIYKTFDVNPEECKKTKEKIDETRKKLILLDNLTWKENKATGYDNHIWQVTSSDFNGNIDEFDEELTSAIEEIKDRETLKENVRLAYIGVPPIFTGIYELLESIGARVVYNEVQRQFTMVDGIGNPDIVEVYKQYTYPYGLSGRVQDIKKNIEQRKVDGVIHYTQAFCFRGIEDIIIREELGDIPVLNLEGDRSVEIDAHTSLRIESFVDMVKEKNKTE